MCDTLQKGIFLQREKHCNPREGYSQLDVIIQVEQYTLWLACPENTWHTAHRCRRMGELDPSQRTKSCAARWRHIIECTRRATAGTGASPCATNEMLPAGNATLCLLSGIKAARDVASVSSVPGVCNYALQHLRGPPSQGSLASMTDLLWKMVWHHALLV